MMIPIGKNVVCCGLTIGLILLSPTPLSALQMDFHGDGTRVNGDADGVTVTEMASPTEAQRTDRPSVPDNPFLDTINVDVTGSVYHHDVDGNRSRSFKDPGTHLLGDVAIEATRDLGGGHRFELQSNVRGTDDPQVSPDKRWQLQSLYGEFRREDDYRLRLGNVSASFSDYSLSSSADLGLYYHRHARHDTGWAWEAYLSRPRRATGTQYRRNNIGVRASTENPGGIVRQYGLNAVYTEDDEGSSGPGTRAVENRVLSVDGKLAVTPDLLVDGEIAHTRTDTDVTSDFKSIADWAIKLNGRYELADTGFFRQGLMDLTYEQVEPEFRSTSGGGSPDQRRVRGRVSGVHYLHGNAPGIDVAVSSEYTEDNLDNQLVRETETMTHQLRAAVSPFENRTLGDGVGDQLRQNLRLTTRFRAHDVETSDTLINRETFEQDYRVESSVGKHDVSGYFQYRMNDNDSTGTVDRRRRSYGADWSYRGFQGLYLGNTLIPADLRLDVARTEDWQPNGSGGSDRTRWSAGTTLYLGDVYRLTVDWRNEDTDNNGSNNDIEKTGWDVGLLGYRIYQDRGQMNLSYRINDVREEQSTNSYREETLRADLEFEF